MAGIRSVKAHRNNYFMTVVLAAVLIFFLVSSRWQRLQRETIVYKDSLDMKAVTVNGTELTLLDMAFYVAYEEMETEKQALVYDPDNPVKYWNLKLENSYTRVEARNAAMQMAIHDELFYQMAVEEEIELSEEDEAYLEAAHKDFWADLTDIDGDRCMGISQEDIMKTMRKVAVAQKYQRIYAEMNNKSYEDYEFAGDAYKKLLDKQNYKINDRVWKRVSMGSVILDH